MSPDCSWDRASRRRGQDRDPASAPARIEAFDLGGRRVLEREVGALGAGSHRFTLPGATFAPGVYTLLLTQGEARVSARAIVVR